MIVSYLTLTAYQSYESALSDCTINRDIMTVSYLAALSTDTS